MHNRKILTVAVAAALGSGFQSLAFAQEDPEGAPIERTQAGNVEIYGKLYPEFTNAKSTGATAAGTAVSTLQKVTPIGLDLMSRNSVDSLNSRLGFRGREDLGGGLRAVWQIENQVPLDNGGSDGVLAKRDSFVGLGGGFGTVRLGNMDTVYKNTGDPIRFMGLASGNFVSTSNIISKAGIGTSSTSSFNLRQKNSVVYNSPQLGGVQVSAQYSPDETRTGNLNAYLASFGVSYRVGGLSVGLAHEIHNDFFGGSNNVPAAIANSTSGTTDVRSKDRATRAAVMYGFAATRIGLDVSQIEYKETGPIASGHFEDYKHKTWALVWEQRWGGPWRTVVAYASSAAGTCSLAGGVACDTHGLNGKLIALGGEYSFSKRTALFVLAARLTNGESATYNNLSQNPAAPDVPTGADITQIAFGVRHDF